jgi:hypothetical protein
MQTLQLKYFFLFSSIDRVCEVQYLSSALLIRDYDVLGAGNLGNEVQTFSSVVVFCYHMQDYTEAQHRRSQPTSSPP